MKSDPVKVKQILTNIFLALFEENNKLQRIIISSDQIEDQV